MVMKSLRKINTDLLILNRQNKFLNPKSRKLLCNPLNQSHFGYVFISWYSLISQKMRKKLRVARKTQLKTP